ncbi:MAG: hypothetical protein H6Q36_1253 [Chloroflexi bacterium]|nr:hypothetical protein [Chloroflexota bacterium]
MADSPAGNDNHVVGTEGRRYLRGDEAARVVARRRRRGWDEAEDDEAARGITMAIERPVDARPRDLTALQQLAGNQAVVQLAGHTAGSAAETDEEESNLPPGPYTGRRKRNDKMDVYDDKHYQFGLDIFREYGPYWEFWTPLEAALGKYFLLNQQTEVGISLATANRRIAAWVIVDRFCPEKAPGIRRLAPGHRRDSALMDAVWAEFADQYRFASRVAEREWRRSNFRLYHEWLAVRFGGVQPPYAYWARTPR